MLNPTEKALKHDYLRRQREQRHAASAISGESLRPHFPEAHLGASLRQTLKKLLTIFLRRGRVSPSVDDTLEDAIFARKNAA